MIDVGRDLERMRDYIAGRLSEAEHRAFEDRLARDPELVRELELSQRLREGLERLREGGALERAQRPAAGRQWLWAAGLAAMIAGVTLLFWLQPLSHRGQVALSPSAPAAGPAARFTFITMRGASSAPQLELPAQGSVEICASRPASAAGARYRVVVDRVGAGGQQVRVAELGGLVPGPDALVHVYAEATALTAGEYELRVQADGDPGAGTELFGFTLRSAVR